MVARKTEAPYKTLERHVPLRLETKNALELETTISAALEELWFDPDDYVYENMRFDNTKFSEILSTRSWEDGTQMTFLELETAKMLQGLHKAYFTRDGVRERLTAGGKAVSEGKVEAEYAMNYSVWQEAQAITRIEQQPRRSSVEQAAQQFGNIAREIGRENILLMGSNYLHNRIAERAKKMADKHARVSDHIVQAARNGLHHGVGHIKGELLKQLLGGPVGTTLSAISTARSLVSTMDRFLGKRSIFVGDGGWEDINTEPDIYVFDNWYGELASRLSSQRSRYPELNGFSAHFNNPRRKDSLSLAFFMQQPFREQVKTALPATFIREGGDYILARMPEV